MWLDVWLGDMTRLHWDRKLNNKLSRCGKVGEPIDCSHVLALEHTLATLQLSARECSSRLS